MITRDDNAPTTFIPMPAVAEGGAGIQHRKARPYRELRKGYTAFLEGDVLFAKITPCMQNAKHAIACDLIDGIGFGSTEFHVLRPQGEIASEWIHYFLLQPSLLADATRHFTGAVGQQRVPEDYLANLQLPLPPLEEQRRIAARLREQLSILTEARAALDAQLEAADALHAASLRAIFDSDKAKAWPRNLLGDVAQVVNGYGFTESLQGRKHLPFPFIKVSDMNAIGAEITITTAANTVDAVLLRQLRARTYPAGTVIFPKVGGALLTNKKRILGVEATFDNNIMGIVPREAESEWIFRWLQTVDLRTLANVQALPSIRQSAVAALQIPMPAPDERRKITAQLEAEFAAAYALRTAIQQKLYDLDKLPSALLSSAFRGEELELKASSATPPAQISSPR